MKLSCIRRLQKYTSTKFVTVPSNFVFIYHACSKLSGTFRYKSNFFDAFHSFHAASRACKYYTLQSIEKIHSQMQTQRKSISIRRRSRRLSFYLLGYMVQIPQLELKKKRAKCSTSRRRPYFVSSSNTRRSNSEELDHTTTSTNADETPSEM